MALLDTRTLDWSENMLDVDEPEGLYKFRVEDARLTIFKAEGEPYEHVLMKVLGFALYRPFYPSMQVDPPPYRGKHKADLLALDYSLEPLFWGECGYTPLEHLLFVLRHSGAKELVIFQWGVDIGAYVDQLEKDVPSQFHDCLTVVSFAPEIRDYIDPDEVILIPDWYELTEL